MKKRILSLLLVICMVVGMLPASVFAADETDNAASETLNPAMFVMLPAAEDYTGDFLSWSSMQFATIILQPGDGPQYYKTDASGHLVDGTAEDYNVKFSYEGKAAQMYLKGATIANDLANKAALYLGHPTDASDATRQANYEIIVEGDSYINQTNGTSGLAILSNTVGTLTVTSVNDAKLAVKGMTTNGGTFHSTGSLVLKDANLFVAGYNNSSIKSAITSTQNVDIIGGNVQLFVKGKGAAISAAGNITVDSAKLTAYAAQYASLEAAGEKGVTFKDSWVMVSAYSTGKTFAAAPNITGYAGGLTVTTDTAQPYNYIETEDNNVVIAFNPKADSTAVTSDEWNAETVAASRVFEIKPANKGNGTVKLPNGDTQTSYSMAMGDDAMYFTVSADGDVVQITERASYKDYKLKLSYPVSGVLTLTLNGAQLTGTAKYGIGVVTSATCPAKIVTEADSTVIASNDSSGVKGVAFGIAGGGDAIFTSVNNATLTVSGALTGTGGYIDAGGNVIFENANMQIDGYTLAWGGSAYAVNASGNVTIKGGSFVHTRPSSVTIKSVAGFIGAQNIYFEDTNVMFSAVTNINTGWSPAYFNARATENPTIQIKNSVFKAGITSDYGNAPGLFNVAPTLDYDVCKIAKGTRNIADLDAEGNFAAMTNPVVLTSGDANAITYRHVEITPSEHVFETKVSDKRAETVTCEHGDMYYVQCSNCDLVSDTVTVETTKPAPHTWADATCTTGKVCSVCKKEFAYGNDPFYMVNLATMGGTASDSYSNAYGMVQLWANGDNVVEYEYNNNKITDVVEIAKIVKEIFADYPVGARYINLTLVAKSFKSTYENGIYMDNGVKITQDWLNEFLPAYKAIGGQLDGVSVDLEFEYGRGYDLRNIYDNKHHTLAQNTEIYKWIYNDPRFVSTGMKQMMIDRGVTFDENAADPLYIIHTDDKACAAYDEAFYILMNRYIDEAMKPLSKYYPDARLFDYDRGYSEAWQGLGLNSGSGVAQGTANRVGNSSNMSLYMLDPSYLIFGYGWKPHGYNKGTFAATAFNAAKYNVERFKQMLAATPVEEDGSKNVSVWIAEYNFVNNGRAAWTNNSPYYAEAILHLGLANPSPFIGYIKPPVLKDENDKEYSDVETYNKYLAAVNSLMVELTLVAGTDDRTPIELPYSWNDDYILSGMKAGGRNIWRITPEDGLKDFLVMSKNGTPTFRAGGQTIIFPQGRIVTTGNTIDYEYGTCGYWVETPEGVNPVVVSDTDRYSANGYIGTETKADLRVYNKLGYLVDGVNTGFTAYRVDWMNVTNGYKYAIVKNNGVKIREELMAPGQDSFFVGEIESGTNELTVEIVDAPDYVADDPYASDDFFWADATKPNHDYKYVDNGDGTHDYACDCGEEGAVAIDNEAHEFADDNDATCDKCGHERELGCSAGNHTYTNAADAICNLCDYQRPYDEVVALVDDSLTITKHTINMQSSLSIAFKVEPEKIAGAVDYWIEMTKPIGKYTPNDYETLNKEQMDAYAIGTILWPEFQRIPACDMGTQVSAVLYVVDADGIVRCGNVDTISVEKYLYDLIATYKAYPDYHKWITVAVELLNYGALAQQYNDMQTDKLVNAKLTADDLSYALDADPTPVNNRDWGADNNAKEVVFKSSTLNFQQKIYNEIKIDVANLTSAAKEDLVVVVKHQKTGEVLQEIPFGAFNYSADNQYWVPVTEIPAYEMTTIYTIEVYAGDVLLSSTATYSVDSYVQLSWQHGLEGKELALSALRYGVAAGKAVYG